MVLEQEPQEAKIGWSRNCNTIPESSSSLEVGHGNLMFMYILCNLHERAVCK
jgi:hypothetical protein